MNWLQIRMFDPYFSPFLTNSYGYYFQTSQNLFSNRQCCTLKLIDWLNPHQHTVSFISKQIDITVRALAYVADTS